MSAPKYWRLLNEGESIAEGDEEWNISEGRWESLDSVAGTANPRDVQPVRRPCPEVEMVQTLAKLTSPPFSKGFGLGAEWYDTEPPVLVYTLATPAFEVSAGSLTEVIELADQRVEGRAL